MVSRSGERGERGDFPRETRRVVITGGMSATTVARNGCFQSAPSAKPGSANAVISSMPRERIIDSDSNDNPLRTPNGGNNSNVVTPWYPGAASSSADANSAGPRRSLLVLVRRRCRRFPSLMIVRFRNVRY